MGGYRASGEELDIRPRQGSRPPRASTAARASTHRQRLLALSKADTSWLQAFVLLREFILGNNRTGLVTTSRGHTTVIGGEDKNFAGIITGQPEIYYGSGTTQFTYTAPTLTIAEWETFIAVATATP